MYRKHSEVSKNWLNRVCGYNITCLGVKIPRKTVHQKQNKNINPPVNVLSKATDKKRGPQYNAYSFHTMSPVLAFFACFILGEMTLGHFLSWGSPQDVVKLKTWTMISRLAAIEYRSPRDQFYRLLTFINT